jgi:hypothetical protein
MQPAAATHPSTHPSRSLRRIKFSIATRGLVGLRNQLLTATRGMGIVNTIFDEYRPVAGDIMNREQGSLVAFETGQVTAYALESAQERGLMFCRWVVGWHSCAGVANECWVGWLYLLARLRRSAAASACIARAQNPTPFQSTCQPSRPLQPRTLSATIPMRPPSRHGSHSLSHSHTHRPRACSLLPQAR